MEKEAEEGEEGEERKEAEKEGKEAGIKIRCGYEMPPKHNVNTIKQNL